MFSDLRELRIFEDSCLIQIGDIPPERYFGTYDYKNLANDLGGPNLSSMIEINFKRDFDIN